MTRILAQYLPVNLAFLGALELSLSFALIYLTLAAPPLADAVLQAPPLLTRNTMLLAIMLALIVGTIAATIGLYKPALWADRRNVLLNATITGAIAFPIVLLIIDGVRPVIDLALVLRLAGMLGVWIAGVMLIRLAASQLARRGFFTRRVLMLGVGPEIDRIRTLVDRRARVFALLDGPVDTATLSPSALHAQRIWGIVSAHAAATPLLNCKLRGIRVMDAAAFQERYLGNISPDIASPDWLLRADGFHRTRLSEVVQRTIDIVGSLALLVLTVPLMLVTVVLIRLDSRGPILYRQQRAGLHDRPFTLFKFRSMAADAEAGGTPRWAQTGDPRVTRVGRFIRQVRIDELPQLINVLRGEMSLVGPRPERPHFVAQLQRAIPSYHLRACVKPGVTGWAQVNYPYGASIEDAREKLAYDLYYVKNQGILLDLLILAATVRVVLFREGAR